MSDWIALVEAAYDLTGRQEEWLARLVQAAAPLLDIGHGVTGQIVANPPGSVSVEDLHVHGDRPQVQLILRTIGNAPPEAIDLTYRSGVTASTMSETVFAQVPGAAEAFADSTDGRFRDALGIIAYTGIDKVVALNTPLEQPRTMNPRERRLWGQVAAHVGAGLRLRHVLGDPGPGSDEVEAVLDPSARVLDASGPAGSRSSIEVLREGARRIVESRGELRSSDPGQALDQWRALVRGRWSLVDRFETDGRHYFIAVRNQPRIGDPRGLTQGEMQVAELLGLGRSAKEIAYTLGITASAVHNTVARVRAKLGLGSRGEVAAFFSPRGLRARLRHFDLGEESFLVGGYSEASEDALARLTEAERDVALLLLQGATNRAIAETRRVSESTVANQIKAIFAKFGVHNRAALAALLADLPGDY